MYIFKFATAISCLIASGCATIPDSTSQKSNISFIQELRRSITSFYSESGRATIFWPRVAEIQPGDVFVSPSITATGLSVDVDKKICSLNDVSSTGRKIEQVLTGQAVLMDKTFNVNASVSADILKIFSLKINDGTKPVYSVRTKFYNPQLVSVDHRLRNVMYPDNSECAKSIKAALARKRTIIVIDQLIEVNYVMAVSHSLDASLKLKDFPNIITGVQASAGASSSLSLGGEGLTKPVAVAVRYRKINSVAAIRRE